MPSQVIALVLFSPNSNVRALSGLLARKLLHARAGMPFHSTGILSVWTNVPLDDALAAKVTLQVKRRTANHEFICLCDYQWTW